VVGTHDVMLTHPEPLARILLEAPSFDHPPFNNRKLEA
jgi:hypothetical protein